MMLLKQTKLWQRIAGINGFCAVSMVAVAAHAISNPSLAALAEKASFYQLIHAVALVALAPLEGTWPAWIRWSFLSGILFFSGTLYFKSLTGQNAITHLAPLGGLSFMVGWLLVIGMGLRKD